MATCPKSVVADDEPPEAHQVLQCLSRAEALRDCVTNDHEGLVGVVAAALCEALGFEPNYSESVGRAAQLHDIGKFALPSDMLHKPGRLSPEEWAVVKKHTEIGHGILQIDGSPFLSLAAMLALCHHEHFDGSGYPRGLAGDAIPFEARVVAVADTYEALRANRAYKKGVGHEEAIAIILQGDDRSRPAQYDPSVLRALGNAAPIIAERYEACQTSITLGRQQPSSEGGT